MIFGLAVLARIAVTSFAAAPARTASAVRPAELPAAPPLPFPAGLTSGEVEWMLDRELPAGVTVEVCRLAAAREVPPALLWAWTEAHGPVQLALALSAGYSRSDLALTRAAGTALDRESLELLAELVGGHVGAIVADASRHCGDQAA